MHYVTETGLEFLILLPLTSQLLVTGACHHSKLSLLFFFGGGVVWFVAQFCFVLFVNYDTEGKNTHILGYTAQCIFTVHYQMKE